MYQESEIYWLDARNVVFRLAKKKFVFAQSRVSYVGYVVEQEGVGLDPAKIQAIHKFLPPTNITEMRGFMVLVNQLSEYSKRDQ